MIDTQWVYLSIDRIGRRRLDRAWDIEDKRRCQIQGTGQKVHIDHFTRRKLYSFWDGFRNGFSQHPDVVVCTHFRGFGCRQPIAKEGTICLINSESSPSFRIILFAENRFSSACSGLSLMIWSSSWLVNWSTRDRVASHKSEPSIELLLHLFTILQVSLRVIFWFVFLLLVEYAEISILTSCSVSIDIDERIKLNECYLKSIPGLKGERVVHRIEVIRGIRRSRRTRLRRRCQRDLI